MTHRPRVAALTAAILGAAVMSGCLGGGGEENESAPIRGKVLVIYSSLPATGPSAAVAGAVAAGERQALADAHGRVGRYRIQLVQLPSTKPGRGVWDPGQVSENASRAARDPRTIAYLGELNLGASAISVPETNKAGILQVSPGDGLTSLTDEPPGRPTVGPERYYPSERRTFLRLVPDDVVQAELIVKRMEALGVDRPALVVGPGVYARELAADLAANARAAGIEFVDAQDLRDDPDAIRSLPRELGDEDPDAVVLAVARSRDTRPLLAGLGRALPQARFLTASGVLVTEPIGRGGAALPPLEATAPQAPQHRPGSAARRALVRIARGQGAVEARPEALWGYESVRIVLAAIAAAKRRGEPARRGRVVREALTPRTLHSVIGTYDVRPTGAVDGLPLALYRLDGNRFVFVRTLE